jgi:hypothetical protein
VTSISLLLYLEVILSATALSVLIVRKQWADYSSLGCFLALRIASNIVLTSLHSYSIGHPLARHAAYHLYFFVYWISFALESVLTLLIVYGVFRLAMAPLKGLQTLGMLVFKWAASISVAVALGSAFVPHMGGMTYFVAAISQLQRTQSILTLCLLLFVCFAIRPMGLSYSSRIFGVSLGLGMMATNDLVQSAWLAINPDMHNRAYNLINGIVICTILATWTCYFALHDCAADDIAFPALESDLAGARR